MNHRKNHAWNTGDVKCSWIENVLYRSRNVLERLQHWQKASRSKPGNEKRTASPSSGFKKYFLRYLIPRSWTMNLLLVHCLGGGGTGRTDGVIPQHGNNEDQDLMLGWIATTLTNDFHPEGPFPQSSISIRQRSLAGGAFVRERVKRKLNIACRTRWMLSITGKDEMLVVSRCMAREFATSGMRTTMYIVEISTLQ